MFMSKKTRVAIYVHLYKEGVLVCEKDVKKLKHHELDLPNLHVVKAMLSLKSRGFVREVFNWQWHYFFLTDEGIAYLRTYLHIPEDVVPATLKRVDGAEKAASRAGPPGGFGDRPRRDFNDRPPRREGGFAAAAGGGAPRA